MMMSLGCKASILAALWSIKHRKSKSICCQFMDGICIWIRIIFYLQKITRELVTTLELMVIDGWVTRHRRIQLALYCGDTLRLIRLSDGRLQWWWLSVNEFLLRVELEQFWIVILLLNTELLLLLLVERCLSMNVISIPINL